VAKEALYSAHYELSSAPKKSYLKKWFCRELIFGLKKSL